MWWYGATEVDLMYGTPLLVTDVLNPFDFRCHFTLVSCFRSGIALSVSIILLLSLTSSASTNYLGNANV